MATPPIAAHASDFDDGSYERPLLGAYSKKLGIWLFLLSDSLTFGTLLFSYTYSRISAGDEWPTPFDAHSIVNASVMTAVLLSSSLTMVLAVRAAGAGQLARRRLWLAATIFFGVAFIVLHLREWQGLITAGVMPGVNPFGAAQFGGTFFTLTGMHMLHVAIGVILLGVIAARRKYSAHAVEVAGLYWHFVDLVWMFIFPLVYLLSAKVR